MWQVPLPVYDNKGSFTEIEYTGSCQICRKYLMSHHVLIAEDSKIQAEMLRSLLIDSGYRVSVARDGAQALELVQLERPDLLVSDVTMPVMDGFELCRNIRKDPHLCSLPVILLTAMTGVKDIIHGLNAGADNYVTKPFDNGVLLARVQSALRKPSPTCREEKLTLNATSDGRFFQVHAGPQQMLNLLLSTYQNALEQNKLLQATQIKLTQLNSQLQQEVERQSKALIEEERKLSAERELLLKQRSAHHEQMHSSLIDSVEAIAATIEVRDPYTSGHQRRVADLSLLIGKQLQLSEFTLEGLHIAASVHDIGKIRIPAEILTKPGRLDPAEFELIKLHAAASFDILKGIHFPWPIAKIVMQHHERLDGTGYPHGLKDDEIMQEAMIIAVADVIESMATARPYRKSLGIEAAIAEVQKGRGSKFTPEVVDAFMSVHENQLWSPNF